MVRGKIVETEEIPAYCAVALAGIGDLPDTILTRSVIIRMRRRAPDENVEPYRRRVHGPDGAVLRDLIAAWAETVIDQLTDAWPEMLDGITDRDADVWEPLLATYGPSEVPLSYYNAVGRVLAKLRASGAKADDLIALAVGVAAAEANEPSSKSAENREIEISF